MASNQAYLFVVFTLVGIAIGVLFDIFRILRKTIKTRDFITCIEDILFWILTGIIIIYSMYRFCDGELRFFMIIGAILGTIIYLITISEYTIKISLLIINFIKKVVVFPTRLLIKLLKRIIFRPICIICVNFRRDIVKKIKKYRGFLQKKENYNNI